MRITVSRESVKDFLDVLVLLEFVDEGQHFRGLLLGQLGRNGADVFVFRRYGVDVAHLESFLELAEVGEGAANDDQQLPFLARALSHLLETVVDEVQLENNQNKTNETQTKNPQKQEQEAD